MKIDRLSGILILTKSDNFYKKGDIVEAPFPYQSDAEQEKCRPVLILAPVPLGGFICAYITSKSHRDGSIPILAMDFKEGGLSKKGKISYDSSYIQPATVYTLNGENIRFKHGTLKDEKVNEVTQTLVDLLQQPPESPPIAKAFERPKKPL